MGGMSIAKPSSTILAHRLPPGCSCMRFVCDLVLLGALACFQAVAHHGPTAVSVRLGALLGQPQAQLDGFKSRALRAGAGAQRNLYTTEWRRIKVAGDAGAEVLVISDDSTVDCERLLSEMSHAESNANRSWTLRVGKAGNMYSFVGPFGESVPPQYHPGTFESVQPQAR